MIIAMRMTNSHTSRTACSSSPPPRRGMATRMKVMSATPVTP
jgi:hypothetical protein